MKKLAIALSGLVLPGVGHIVLGRRGKGVLLLVLLTGMFIAGVSMDPDYYGKFGPGPFVKAPQVALQDVNLAELAKDEGTVDRVWRFVFTYLYPFVVGFVPYLLGSALQAAGGGLVCALPFVESWSKMPVTVKDIGYCFALVAGLLNVLVMLDAYDIAYNAELIKERWKNN